MIIAAISTIGALAALRAAFVAGRTDGRKGRAADGDSVEANGEFAVAGRLTRLEQNLNEFRAETLRAIELLRMETPVSRIRADQDRSPLMGDSGGTSEASERDQVVAAPEAKEADPAATSSPTEKPVAPEVPEALGGKLKATRRGFFERLRSVFSLKPRLDEESVEELRALLIGADLGVKTTERLIARAREELKRGVEVDEAGFSHLVRSVLIEVLESANAEKRVPIEAGPAQGKPRIVLVVGVNGVGKTTTVAKLAHQLTAQGAKVLLVAADTFRAAAVAQLSEWAQRLNVPVVTGPDNAKPQTVIFDAMERLSQEPFDVVLIDTAGRLQTKASLMQELEGVRNAISRHQCGAPHETLLVVDGSTGQNAISQAREFNEATPLTGVIVTKLDGTPKGGVVVAIADEFGIPVRYIGVGESPADLRPFSAQEFAEALFGDQDEGDSVDSNVLSLTGAHGEQRRRRRAIGEA
jgi:fused signal recognition particle receptor